MELDPPYCDVDSVDPVDELHRGDKPRGSLVADCVAV